MNSDQPQKQSADSQTPPCTEENEQPMDQDQDMPPFSNASMVTPAPGSFAAKTTPAIVRTRQVRHLMETSSPSDAIMSPFSQKLNTGAAGTDGDHVNHPAMIFKNKADKPKPKRLIHQVFTAPPPPAMASLSNTSVQDEK